MIIGHCEVFLQPCRMWGIFSFIIIDFFMRSSIFPAIIFLFCTQVFAQKYPILVVIQMVRQGACTGIAPAAG